MVRCKDRMVVLCTAVLAIASISHASAFAIPSNAWVPSFASRSCSSGRKRCVRQSVERTSAENIVSTTSSIDNENESSSLAAETRALGSQELLMLPRQYGPHLSQENSANKPFPQMCHVSATVLDATPPLSLLQKAIDNALATHPLLRCHVRGTGEPEKRIDLFQMVREGEPDPCTFVAPLTSNKFSSQDVLSVVEITPTTQKNENARTLLDRSWKSRFETDLDNGNWCNTDVGPLWRMELHQFSDSPNSSMPCALVFTFNHAISDQRSANMLVDQILADIADMEEQQQQQNSSDNFPSHPKNPVISQSMPLSLEESVLGQNNQWSNVGPSKLSLGTAAYVAGKAAEGFKNPVILPDNSQQQQQQQQQKTGDSTDDDAAAGNAIMGAVQTIMGRVAGGITTEERKSVVQYRQLDRDATNQLLEACRRENVAMTYALNAAVALTASDFIGLAAKSNKSDQIKKRNYKVLQSLDMRRFGQQLDKADTMACMAGSMDIMLGPISDRSGESIRHSRFNANDALSSFWDLARDGRDQTNAFVESSGPEHAVRVFDFAMTISDMNNLVHLTAQSKDSQGRAYSAGISNVGVYERQEAFQREGHQSRDSIKVQHGKYGVQDVFFATSHARTGCLYQVSCMTVNGSLKLTFHPASPIVDESTNVQFADAFMELLEIVSGVRDPSRTDLNGDDKTNERTKNIKLSDEKEEKNGLLSFLPPNSLVFATTLLGIAGIATHAGAYAEFFDKVMQMKENVPNPDDFWAAMNFWIFFAVGHPILQPILWISDVLHGTPGPKIADLVPWAFLAGNLVVIAAVALSKEIRNSVNIGALAAFLAYVGAGLDGQAGLGDYNLQLDDSYKGKIVRGCPSYDDVRQPSMNNFDITKYQGLWYEQKFHDWTQFKEVYDTSLDIKLTSDGKGWKDDFAVKGPAPDAAKLSWDKSPVANGAHYFLFGRVDENDPSGVLRESGFGVEFPNYIVDVKTDPQTGEYTESIQFQCLERGGVRVFEGINFLSRKPQMTSKELAAMHSRAEKAGMYPYGASPGQMHSVARRPIDAPQVDNSWQAMWRAIGFDKLLELLTESIEDGGR